VNVRLPIVMVPVRAGSELAATLNETVPFPLPVAADVTVIQESLVAAVQVQPAAAVTEIGAPAPPAAPNDPLEGSIAIVQPSAWFTVKVLSAIVMTPLRAGPVFAPTENSTEPSPVPLVPDVTVIQGAALAADQAQPGAVVTAIAGPAPAPLLSDADDGAMA
jgi:hypothetical protein